MIEDIVIDIPSAQDAKANDTVIEDIIIDNPSAQEAKVDTPIIEDIIIDNPITEAPPVLDPIQKIEANPPLLSQTTVPLKKLTRKEAFASQLAGELPRCPECSRLLRERTVSRCDYCGFSFSYLNKLLPEAQLPALEPILDFSKKLDKYEKKTIKKASSRLKKRYPQFILKVCLIPLQPEIEVRQMALWMVNQCPTLKNENETDRGWYVLLLIDTAKCRSALAYGYQADIFIPDESSWKIITKLNRSLKKQKLGSVIAEQILELLPVLETTKRMVKRKYKSFKRKN